MLQRTEAGDDSEYAGDDACGDFIERASIVGGNEEASALETGLGESREH